MTGNATVRVTDQAAWYLFRSHVLFARQQDIGILEKKAGPQGKRDYAMSGMS